MSNPGIYPYAKRCELTASHAVEFEGPEGQVGSLELCRDHRMSILTDPIAKILGDKRINYR